MSDLERVSDIVKQGNLFPAGEPAKEKKSKSASKAALRRMEAAALAAQQVFDRTITIQYLHTVLAQTCLPYRDPGEGVLSWKHENGGAYLNLTSRKAFDPLAEDWVQVGLPFGPKPRLIMAHLTTEALLKGTSTLETDETVTGFVTKALQMDPKGRNIRTVKDQMMRLAITSIDIAIMTRPGYAIQRHSKFVDGMEVWAEDEEEKRVIWPKVINFSERFYQSLQKHAVPLNETHLMGLANSAAALDVYVWLAQRLRRVKGVSESISWRSLYEQFGYGYANFRKFKQSFTDTLRQVLVFYSEAKLASTEHGLTLYPSRPPVPEKIVAVGGKDLWKP